MRCIPQAASHTKHDTFIKRFLKVSKRLVNEKHFKNVYQTFFFYVFLKYIE
jgi:hypothetical protein